MPTYVSPGVGGFPDRFTRSPTGGYQKFNRAALTSGAGQAFRPKGTTRRSVVQVRGLNALIVDLAAMQQIVGELAWHVTDTSGQRLTLLGQRYAPVSNYDTNKGPATYYPGALRDSISMNMWTEGSRIGFDSGPTVYYAPFVHFGTVRQAPNPFMFKASDEIEPMFKQGHSEVAKVFAHARSLSEPFRSPTASVFGKYRAYLYSFEKSLGDIGAFGLSPLVSGPRQAALRGARAIGDIDSVMSRTVGTRIAHRLEGRASGRIIGYGRRFFSSGANYSSFIGGTVGARIYHRTVARYVNLRWP
jgi:hypothetical protein